MAQRFGQLDALRQAWTDDGRTLAQIALAWIWARSERTIPIPGFKSAAQVQENVKAMDFAPLSHEQMEKINAVFGRKGIGG
jgi:aryl-alcohol dehydrogenase-like predicted oxidoreductase